MAGTIRFLCTTVLKSSLDDTLPQFEREGYKVEVSYGPSAQLTKRIVGRRNRRRRRPHRCGFDEMVQAGKAGRGEPHPSSAPPPWSR